MTTIPWAPWSRISVTLPMITNRRLSENLLKNDYIVLNADRIEDSTIFCVWQGNYNQMWEVDFLHGLKSEERLGIRITWINP